MKSISRVLLAGAGLLAVAAAQDNNGNGTAILGGSGGGVGNNSYTFDTNCYEGAYVIVVRASTEPQGFGIQREVSDNITAQIPNSQAVALVYPATIFGPVVYTDSQPQGVGNLTELVRAYGDRCPDNRMILMGYSQGAHVIGDALIGRNYTTEAFGNTTGPMEQRYLDRIAAVLMMGDPAFVPDQPFDVGNATQGGVFTRVNTDAWAATGLASRLVSYCDAQDQFCDRGDSLAVHLGYVPEYGEQAVRFAVDRWNEGSNGNGGGNNSNNSNGTGTGTGTGGGSDGQPAGSATEEAASSDTNAAAAGLGVGAMAATGMVGALFAALLL